MAQHGQVVMRQGVAIRPRLLREEEGGAGAARAGHVLDDHRLALVALEHLEHLPVHGVQAAAGRPGDQEADRPVREAALGQGGRGEGRHRQRQPGEEGASQHRPLLHPDAEAGHHVALPGGAAHDEVLVLLGVEIDEGHVELAAHPRCSPGSSARP
jgi:hypothetical protein